MSHREEVKLSCSCGAQMIYAEVVSESYFSHTSYRVSDFLKAHEICRAKPQEDKDLKKLLEVSNGHHNN